MRSTDLRIEEAAVTFSDEKLAVPLRLSKGDIREITYVQVTLAARTRSGQTVQGQGAILLSDLWAFPSAVLSHAQKDAAMRELCRALAAWLPRDDWGDPLEKGVRLEAMLPLLTAEVAAGAAHGARAPEGISIGPALEAMPKLAMLDCMAAFDAAIHDAWGHALGRSVYTQYDAANLNQDLSAYLGGAFAGRYPADYLRPMRRTLAVQHVIGVGDPLTTGGAKPAAAPGVDLPASLEAWIRRDGVGAFKVKTAGRDPAADARQLIDVHSVASRVGGGKGPLRLSIDPNEGCRDPAFLIEMLAQVERDEPRALAALDYIEQPFPRGAPTSLLGEPARKQMQRVAQWAPLIIDESLDNLEMLPDLQEMGWSGLAVKTCKGHTHSLLAYCWARQARLFVTLQDLTNIGLALVHSANLCAHMELSVDYFECNQRQYLPLACPQIREEYAPYFSVSAGNIHLASRLQPGLY